MSTDDDAGNSTAEDGAEYTGCVDEVSIANG